MDTTTCPTPINTNTTTVQQVGRMNLLAISGGRVVQIDDHTINLPVHYGYSVEIELDRGRDLYTVRRMWRRGTTVKVKGELSGLYSDQLGDAAYRASCFRDDFGN